MYLFVDWQLCTSCPPLDDGFFLLCRAGMALEYAAYFMPRRSLVCEEVLEREGVKGDIQVAEYPLDFIPFDSDVLSLEMEAAFKVGWGVHAAVNILTTAQCKAMTAGAGTQTAAVPQPAVAVPPNTFALRDRLLQLNVLQRNPTATFLGAGIARWLALKTM